MNLRTAGYSLFVASLASATLLSNDARAADGDERRVLKAREVSTEDVSSAYAVAAAEKRLESIKYLKDLLGKSPDISGDQKAEMMLRLADLYFQQGRYLYLGEMAAFDKEYEKCFNTEGCAADTLQANNEESKTWQNKAIRLYEQILSSYPRYPRADEASFYLGSALQDTGRRPEAVEKFTMLVKTYPDSQWVPDAYVNIGEFYFDDNNAYKAMLAYKKAVGFKESPMLGFATYKLAWCYYNVGEYDNAIETMQSVVSMSGADTGTDKSKLALGDEALKDLVRFFADADKFEEAEAYFSKLGKESLINDMYRRLAATYFEQGKWEKCIEAYRRLIARNPNSAQAPDYQSEIIKCYKKLGKKEEILAEIDRLRTTYGKTSSWAKSNASNPEAIKAADEQVELQLRTVATEYHTTAKKLGTGDEAKAAYALAYKSYKLYLTEYPDNSHAYDVRYAFGELLYKVKRFDEAYEQYMTVVKIDPKGQYSIFCAKSAIFAADEMIKKEGGNLTGAASGTPIAHAEPQPLTQWEQNLVDACAQYATLYPTEKEAINVIYRSAYLLYNKYRFAEAAVQFNKVIAMNPASKEAELAAHLILDSFKINEDWAELKKNAKFYVDQPGLGSATFKKEMAEIYERSSFKLIETTLAADNDKGKAADAFVAFYNEFPNSDVGAQALNNATVYYKETNRMGDEIKTRHILVDDPKFGPKTKYYYDQIGALGYDYETVAAFDKAAGFYEKLFALYPKQVETLKKDSPDKAEATSKQAADALYSAAVFRRASGQWEKAIEDYNKFITAFPTDARNDDIKLTIGKIWEEQKKWAEAATVYYAFYTKAPKETPPQFTYFARLQYAKALEAQGQKPKAVEVYNETVALYQKSIAAGTLQPGTQTEYVAEMMYTLAGPKFEKYMALKIQGAGGSSKKAEDAAIEKSLKAKATALVDIEKTYTEIIRTGAGEWGLASLVKLGQVYENMGETLKNSTVPYYLDADQKTMYSMAIDDKVYPQKQKAIAAYSTALSKAYELTLYDENTALATRRLGELDPENYPGLSEQMPAPRFTSSSAKTFDFEKEL